jgi:hypothetical protein
VWNQSMPKGVWKHATGACKLEDSTRAVCSYRLTGTRAWKPGRLLQAATASAAAVAASVCTASASAKAGTGVVAVCLSAAAAIAAPAVKCALDTKYSCPVLKRCCCCCHCCCPPPPLALRCMRWTSASLTRGARCVPR